MKRFLFSLLLSLLICSPLIAQQMMKPSLGDLVGGNYRQHPRYRGVVGHWIMNESGGLTAYDISGNGNHGTLTNGPVWTQGQFGPALSFDGVDDYVDAGTIPAFDSASQISMAGWIYRSATNVHVAFGPRADGTYKSTILWWTDGNIYFSIANGLGEYSYSALSGTGWHHVALVFNGQLSGNARLIAFIDGIQVTLTYGATPPATTASNANQGPMIIGREQEVRYSTGLIDDVRLYNRVLTADEVMSLYSDGFLEFRRSRNWLALLNQQPAAAARIHRVTQQ